MTTSEKEQNKAAVVEEAAGKTEKQVAWICTARVALALIGSLGFMTLYAQRINMSVALVCMVNQTAVELMYGSATAAEAGGGLISSINSSSSALESSCSANGAAGRSTRDGEFFWSKQTQGFVLGAFFYGYIFTQIPGGLLAQRFGGKRVLGCCLFMASIATMLCSLGARVSPYLLIFFRVVIGLCQGVVFVSMHDLWSRWAPPLERSKLIAFTQAGAQIGNVVALPVSALLCDYGFDNGWGSIFYVFGIIGIIWCISWMIIVSDSPAQHPRITTAEREYIETSIGSKSRHLSFSDTPWLQFAKSMPVWAIVVGHTCSNWGIYTLLTNMPAYMKEVLKFDIKSNGLFSAIPYVLFWLFINIGGVTADALRKRGWRTKDVRKIIFSVGSFSGVLLIVLGYVSCEHAYLAVAVLSVATGFCGLQFPSILVNHVDIAPPFAAVLLGISNAAATIPGFVSPYVVKSLTPNLLARHSELEQSETKAQAALVTILSLTQITELKLLLDIGRQGHRFYDFVLTLLVACISLEIFVGVIIIYIGNLHYYQAAEKVAWCYGAFNCFTCFCQNCPIRHKHSGAYESVRETVLSSSQNPKRSSMAGTAIDDTPAGCCDWPVEQQMETIIDLERADCHLESSRVKVADANMKIIRATNYVKVVEDAFKKTPGNSDLEEELMRAREALAVATREREEGEAEQKLAEAQQRHACSIKEHHEDRRERLTFRKVSFWQHMATYLLYFVMLMNVFITTFGISGGSPNSIAVTHTAAATRGTSAAVFPTSTLANVVTINSTHSG